MGERRMFRAGCPIWVGKGTDRAFGVGRHPPARACKLPLTFELGMAMDTKQALPNNGARPGVS